MAEVSANLHDLKIPELKGILRDLGASVSGNKKMLLERIILWKRASLDRKLVKPVEIHVTPIDFPVDLGPIESLDITNFKSFSLRDLEYWFSERNAGASMEKGRKLFLSKFLKCVSALIKENTMFLSCLCAAETRKSVDYSVQVVVESDGTVKQACCTCVAGEGFSVSCKHLAGLLYCLEHYVGSGVLHQLPCKTSVLQTWHLPPAGRRIIPKTALELAGVSGPVGVPMTYTPDLNDAINIAINYKSESMFLKCFRKPSQFSMFSDHDYLKENLLKTRLDKINHVSEQERKTLELKTRKQSKCRIWWRARKTRITSSLVYRVASTVRSKNMAVGVAREILQPKSFSTMATRWGKQNEMKAIKQYETVTRTNIRAAGLYVHPKTTFVASSPDGISTDEEVVLEVKCPYNIRNNEPTSAIFLTYGCGQYHLRKNHPYYYQVQTHMYCTGIERCDFVVWTQKGLYIENICFNQRFMSNLVESLALYYDQVFCAEAEKFLSVD